MKGDTCEGYCRYWNYKYRRCEKYWNMYECPQECPFWNNFEWTSCNIDNNKEAD